MLLQSSLRILPGTQRCWAQCRSSASRIVVRACSTALAPPAPSEAKTTASSEKPQLRWYQSEGMEEVLKRFREGVPRQLIAMPTGAGAHLPMHLCAMHSAWHVCCGTAMTHRHDVSLLFVFTCVDATQMGMQQDVCHCHPTLALLWLQPACSTHTGSMRHVFMLAVAACAFTCRENRDVRSHHPANQPGMS